MSVNLLLHNIGFASGAVIALIFAVFVYVKDHKALPNQTFGLAFLSIAIFCGSHVIGVNISDPIVSRDVLMWNISVIWIGCFLTHCTFSMIEGAVKRQRIFLTGMYAAALILSVIYVAYPDTYLLPSVPKMYFPNYYVPGELQWIMRVIFDIIVPVYFLGYLVYSYRRYSNDAIVRNRLWYFLVAITLGYLIGSIAILLVYNIPIDPAFSAFFVPVLAIPLTYSIFHYSLMDIRIVTKRAVVFGSLVAVFSFGIFLVGYGNFVIAAYVPGFPIWVLPLTAGIAATIIGFVVWNTFKESDMLKYEFVTIMTHKLRTPLTSIKWSAENLSTAVTNEGKVNLQHIKDSAEHLIDLTAILTGASAEDQGFYDYRQEDVDFAQLIRAVSANYAKSAQERSISFVTEAVVEGPIHVFADRAKITFVVQNLLDNAFTYTRNGGRITLSLIKMNNKAIFSVTDSGIGMTKNELRLIFTRFYRSDAARHADTEGMGIALYVAKRTAEHHGGRLWAESDGTGKGSTFYLSLPVVQK